ncbi:MAG: hypothetical protein ACREQZ_00260 [Woeseiaceae bacterium]
MPLPTIRALVVTIAALLTAGPTSTPARAHDSARISQLESTIQQLRIRLDEQQRRIERLENELKGRTGELLVPTIPRRPAGAAKATAKATAKDPLPWHSPEPWSLVKPGMSHEEVVAILGEPTSADSLDNYRSLFYRGTAPNGAELNGHVNLRDGQVVAVKAPDF